MPNDRQAAGLSDMVDPEELSGLSKLPRKVENGAEDLDLLENSGFERSELDIASKARPRLWDGEIERKAPLAQDQHAIGERNGLAHVAPYAVS